MRISDWSSDVCSSDLQTEITLGQYKAPFGLESNNSDNYNVFLERGTFNVAAANLGAERRIGASAAYVKPNFTATIGVFGDNEGVSRASGTTTSTPGESWGINGRVTDRKSTRLNSSH